MTCSKAKEILQEAERREVAIQDIQPGEKRMVHVVEFEIDSLQTGENSMHVLYPWRTPSGLKISFEVGNDVHKREWSASSAFVTFGSVQIRMEPPVPVLWIPRPITKLKALGTVKSEEGS